MIKLNELRIGNTIEYHLVDTVGNVDEWVETTIDWADLRQLLENEEAFNQWHRPIPLSEELLLRLGFENKGNNRFSFDRLDVYTKNASDAYEIQLWNFDGNICWVQFLHEFQNAVKVLTGQELTLKP